MIARLTAALLVTGSCAIASTGCVAVVSHSLVAPPNRGQPFDPRRDEDPPAAYAGRHVRVESEGPDPASLSVWILEPERPLGGTVLVLHGLYKRKEKVLHFAPPLLEAGFRVVLADLRGHGRSRGEHLTYGVRDAADLSRLLDALEEAGDLAEPVGVMGPSYGGATSILLAARDDRVHAVVSLAAFATLRTVVPRYVRLLLPTSAFWLPETTIQAAIDAAGARADFDPDEASPAAHVGELDRPLLIVHGLDDFMVPVHHAYELFARAGPGAEIAILPDLGHWGIQRDSDGRVRRLVAAWFLRVFRKESAVDRSTAPEETERPG